MATAKKTCTNKTKKTSAKKSVKNDKPNLTADDLPFKIVEPKIKVDPNSGLIEQVFEDDKKEDPEKQIFGKNADRAHALRDLWFEDIKQAMKEQKIPPEAQNEVMFMMLSNSMLDFVLDIMPPDMALEVSHVLDDMIGRMLVEKKYDCNLGEEEEKALSLVKREDYETEDDYNRALDEIYNHWWNLGQPRLDMRSPKDAIYETQIKYGLNR